MNLEGSLVALVTPMKLDGSVDWLALDHLLEWHLDSGTNGIVPMGTTGESATLDTDEHLKVIQRTIEVVSGRIPVIAGTGSNSTAEAIHQTQEAERAGADACLLVTPYYNKPTQEGLYAHYEKIASETSVPIILYNVPPRTACDMSSDTIARLSEVPGIVGVKEACGDAGRVQDIRSLVQDDFIILSGEDAQTRQMFDYGASGTISVTANVLPREMSDFCQSYLSGDVSRCDELDKLLQPIHEVLFIEVSPSPTKWVLAQMGKIDGGIRLPLLPLSEDNRALVLERIKEFGVIK